jgi:sugar transferase EpsL
MFLLATITGEREPSRIQAAVKRVLDLAISATVLILTSPIWLLLALLIKLESKGPIFFRQERPGLSCRPFTIIKFRTMLDARNSAGDLLPDKDRLTRLGRFLRSTSLDELPELLNVLKGEMSVVGPRPLLTRYLARYSKDQLRRQEVKPGLTGWAQINGRNALTWDEKFRLDVWYVDHRSLALDIKILIMTVWKILKREGINQPGQATMEEFRGSTRQQ